MKGPQRFVTMKVCFMSLMARRVHRLVQVENAVEQVSL